MVTPLLKRRCDPRNTVILGRFETASEHVGDEEADGSRLLIVVSARGGFVAVLRNHAEIVLGHANRECPNSAALPFPQGSRSLGRRPHVLSLRQGMVHANPFPRRERPKGPMAVGLEDRLAPAPVQGVTVRQPLQRIA